jgi:hypothetical protein
MLLLRLEQADELAAIAWMLLRALDGLAPRFRVRGVAGVQVLNDRKVVRVGARERPDPGKSAYVYTRELEAARGLGADR